MNANKRPESEPPLMEQLADVLREIIDILVAPRRPAPAPVRVRAYPERRVVRRPDW